MIDELLTLSGFEKDITYKETRFLNAPKTSYCVYLDDYEELGADDLNLYRSHTYTIELYSYKADKKSEKAIESAFKTLNIQYSKQSRYWIEDEKLYQCLYEFTCIEDLEGD